MYFTNKLIDSFLPKELKETSPLQYYQIKTLVSLIFFCIIVASFSLATNFLQQPSFNFIALAIYLGGVVLLFLIRFIRSSWALGTLICSVIVITCAIEMPFTGGVFSDTLHWLVVVPLVSLVLSGRKQALMWLVGFFFYLAYLCYDSYSRIDVMVEGLRQFNGIYTYFNCFLVLTSVYIVADMQHKTQQIVIDELNKKNAELEQQTQNLRQKEEQLSKTNRELEHFAFAASHDMKEPMRMIGMYTQLMSRRLKDVEIKDKEEFTGYITDGVNRMETMLDDLLAYSRIGKTPQLKVINLNELLLIVKNNLAVKVKEYNAIIESDDLPTLKIASTEFIQLFQNLIANAIKFSKPEVKPYVYIHYVEQPRNHRFVVEDNGIGVAKEFQERIFNIFERLHSHAEIKGSGIGLATCQKVIEQMNGKIWVESELGVGTKVIFEFPK
jgi:signal transduction histidine kinase